MILAILRKDLLGDGRNGRSHALRAAYLLLLACVAVPALQSFAAGMAVTGGFASLQQGLEFSLGFGFMQIGLVLLLAPALAIGSLSRERTAGTLELLHVAGAPPQRVLLGKFAARAAWLSASTLSSMPLLFIGTLMGGAGAAAVTLLVLHAMMAGAVGTAIGLAVAGVVRRVIPALVLSYGILFLAYVIPAGLTAATGPSAAGLLSPFASIAWTTNGTAPIWTAWVALLPPLAVTLALLALSSHAVAPGEEVDAARAVALERALDLIEPPLGPYDETVSRRASREVSGNPVFWRESRSARHGPGLRLLRLIYLVAGGAIAALFFLMSLQSRADESGARYASFLLCAGTGALALVVASTSVTVERESQTLPLLSLSGMSGMEILLAKFEGLFLFLWPVAVLPVIPAIASIDNFLPTVIASGALLIAGLSCGLAISSFARRSLAAVTVSIAGAILYTGVLPFSITRICPACDAHSSLWTLIVACNPLLAAFRVIGLENETSLWAGLGGLVVCVLASLAALPIAGWKVSRAA